MARANSSHLGVIEHVPPKIVLMTRVVELSITGENQPQPENSKYILHLMVDSPDVSLFFLDNPAPSKIEADFVKKIDDTLILNVTLRGKEYTLQCNQTSIYKYTPRGVISEDERDAASLIAANEVSSSISPLFVNIHGHGRLWHTQGSDTETWEVLLIDKIQFLSDIKFTDKSYYTFMAFAFIRLGILHSKQYIYGHPALGHLAFKLDSPVYKNQRIVWIKGLSIQNIQGMRPMTKNILMLKDITTLLLDNSKSLQDLNVTKLEEIDFNVFNFYALTLTSRNFSAAMPIIMPLAILNADITDDTCQNISKSALSDVAFNYWSQDRSQEIRKLEESLSDEDTLQKIIQGIIHHYKTYGDKPLTVPPPREMQTNPTSPPPPPPSIPTFNHHPALIGGIYFITINQQLVSPFGLPQFFYKYKFISNNHIVIGVGDQNPLSFSEDPKTYLVTFTTNTVIISPDGRHFPVTFNFLSGIPYVMQAMWGGMTKRLDMRYVPPIEIQ